MNNYFVLEMMEKMNRQIKTLEKRFRKKEDGSAVIGEVLVMIVVVAMAAIFKSGGLKFIQEIWTTMTTTASSMFS